MISKDGVYYADSYNYYGVCNLGSEHCQTKAEKDVCDVSRDLVDLSSCRYL